MNNTILYSSLAFIAGATIGGFVVWKVVDKHYASIAQEEINSVKEKFTVPKVDKKETEKKSQVENPEDVSKKALNKPDIISYNKKLSEGKYVNYSTEKEEPKKSGRYPWEKSEEDEEKPYVISPDEFADGIDEKDDYDQIDLTLYADGILADTEDEIIENVEEVVGDALEHVGDYEDDAVHVCNPKRKAFYEILTDPRKYEEATKKKPHHNNDGED